MLWSLLVLAIAAESPSADQLRFFETNVRPVLVEHCQKCHGEKKQWANLRLDSRDAILKGGDSGPAVIVGKPNESLLVRAIRHSDENLKMPEEGKLSARQIADLERWVEMGLPFPATVRTNQRHRNPHHWAFQPPVESPLPGVNNTAWLQTPIDSFIAAKLEAANLRPAPPADRRTLLRRTSFNLTGLPPTPDEVTTFVADERPDAFARLVDRMLASPAYGERWGRHWLDVARYADSNGLDENVAHGNAWRYRDYVVASFNADKPFDQFVVEQVAGDLLQARSDQQRHEQLIATGFLAIGPKVLAEVDATKMQMDIVDEQIETTGRAFLGMTLGCARCHDHKFDPIDTADYYGLAGIFKSSRVMEHYKKVARWYENVLPSGESVALRAAHDAQVAAKRRDIEAFVATANKELAAGLAADAKLPDKPEAMYPEATRAALKKLRAELTALEKNPPDVPSAMGVTEDQVANVAIHIRGNPLKLGDVVERHMPPVMRGPANAAFSQSESGRRQLAEWLTDAQHPLTSRVIVNRIWRWHFGQGLVRTTDNFGLLGEPPSHPELLDSLSRRFVTDGWSFKTLHRQILHSRVYQQASAIADGTTPSAETGNGSVTQPPSAPQNPQMADPENRLLSHFPVRRLEAEAVRDALLAVGDQLERTIGGSLLKVKNRGYFFDHTSKDLTDYTSRRRSLYLPVVRNNVFDFFQLLDFPDPATSSSDRATTTVAPQALMMMNSELVMQAAADLSARLFTSASHDRQRLSQLYEIAFGRTATAAEQAANESLLAAVEKSLATTEPASDVRQRRAWDVLCHTILASNEFIHVR